MNPEYHNHPNGFSYNTNMLLNDLVIDKNNVLFYIEEYLSPYDIEFLKDYIISLINDGICHPINSDFSDKYIDIDIARIDSNNVEDEMRLQNLIVYRKILRYIINCDNLHVLLDKLFALERKMKRAEDRLLRKNRNGERYHGLKLWPNKNKNKDENENKNISYSTTNKYVNANLFLTKASTNNLRDCIEVIEEQPIAEATFKFLFYLQYFVVYHINARCLNLNKILQIINRRNLRLRNRYFGPTDLTHSILRNLDIKLSAVDITSKDKLKKLYDESDNTTVADVDEEPRANIQLISTPRRGIRNSIANYNRSGYYKGNVSNDYEDYDEPIDLIHDESIFIDGSKNDVESIFIDGSKANNKESIFIDGFKANNDERVHIDIDDSKIMNDEIDYNANYIYFMINSITRSSGLSRDIIENVIDRYGKIINKFNYLTVNDLITLLYVISDKILVMSDYFESAGHKIRW